MTRRSYVQLDSAGTRCIVMNDQGTLTVRLSAYELSLLKRSARGSNEEQRRAAMVATLSGPCCYAFYAKQTHMVKIGMTQNVIRRWAEVENRSGMAIQLMAVWHTAEPRRYERSLHDRFSAWRGLGEWFAADEVIRLITEEMRGATISGTAVPGPGVQYPQLARRGVRIGDRVKTSVRHYERRTGTVNRVSGDVAEVVLDPTHNQKKPTIFVVRVDTLAQGEDR